MTKQIYAFRNSANAVKNKVKLYTYFKLKRQTVFSEKGTFWLKNTNFVTVHVLSLQVWHAVTSRKYRL